MCCIGRERAVDMVDGWWGPEQWIAGASGGRWAQIQGFKGVASMVSQTSSPVRQTVKRPDSWGIREEHPRGTNRELLKVISTRSETPLGLFGGGVSVTARRSSGLMRAATSTDPAPRSADWPLPLAAPKSGNKTTYEPGQTPCHPCRRLCPWLDSYKKSGQVASWFPRCLPAGRDRLPFVSMLWWREEGMTVHL